MKIAAILGATAASLLIASPRIAEADYAPVSLSIGASCDLRVERHPISIQALPQALKKLTGGHSRAVLRVLVSESTPVDCLVDVLEAARAGHKGEYEFEVVPD